MRTRKPIITSRTENFHFSVSFERNMPVEFFIVGRGTVGHDLDEELFELSKETCKIMRGEIEC